MLQILWIFCHDFLEIFLRSKMSQEQEQEQQQELNPMNDHAASGW